MEFIRRYGSFFAKAGATLCAIKIGEIITKNYRREAFDNVDINELCESTTVSRQDVGMIICKVIGGVFIVWIVGKWVKRETLYVSGSNCYDNVEETRFETSKYDKPTLNRDYNCDEQHFGYPCLHCEVKNFYEAIEREISQATELPKLPQLHNQSYEEESRGIDHNCLCFL
uniref:Uncharacterized protein n=1 Tax=Caenorhabditis tropicalis TaxID=1561998 RepID=A0A1I7UR81_9PELO